jgi:uncharacterized FAD-dependent dehydrogenase
MILKSSFPTLKITGRDNFIFAMGNQETLDVLQQKLDDIVSYISTNNSIGLKDLENILKIKSEEERVVTNGMSYHARSGKNANAAVVVSVGGADFANDPRRAIAFQRELEAKAYAAGRAAGAYAAPAENVQSFLEGRGQLHIGSVQPTYDRGVTAADLGALLPGELADTLRAGLRAYERKIAGYTASDAILTGLETRTSSPVRLKREEDFVCTQLAGLYPCGEGAGYAGGIMSAAVDGLRVARAIISRYAPAEG